MKKKAVFAFILGFAFAMFVVGILRFTDIPENVEAFSRNNMIDLGYTVLGNAHWNVATIDGQRFLIVTRGSNGIAVVAF